MKQDTTSVKSPVSQEWIRPSVIAGSWYPGEPEKLARLVDRLLSGVEPVDGEPLALIVPHAGYLFSGSVAAHGFKQLAGLDYEVAVIIAADHQPPVSRPISVWAEGGFETPLGVVPVDTELARALIEASPYITFDPEAHADEHPLEIQLPFLQQVCPDCRIVPILMGSDDEQTVSALATALLQVLPGRRAVVIASSDLSHYPRQQDALRVDSATLAAIETGDPAAVRARIAASMQAKIPGLWTCACGEAPILVAMQVAAGLGADTTTVLAHANSADSPHGNPKQVVGYGAVMFWRYDPPPLTESRRMELLRLARTAIATYLETGQIPPYETNDPVLARRAGVFVTLTKQGEARDSEESLRGCIGHIHADTPLYQIVPEIAIDAATADRRFPPITLAELEETNIEISILSPLHRVTDVRQIQVGTHGVLIAYQGKQGILLPQVPVKWSWDRIEFLESLCLKAGLSADCWSKQSTLYAFTTIEFGEGG